MRLLIRVDGSTQMGLGHLMRCMAMAQLLSKQNIEILFACRKSTLKFCQSREDWIWKSLVVPDTVDLKSEPEWIKQKLFEEKMSAILLDGYQFDEDYRKLLFESSVFGILMDDNNDSGLLHCDMVINSAPNANKLDYQLTCPNGIHCLGAEYRVLRQEFYNVKPKPLSERTGLTITFGGSDPFNFTLSMINMLKTHSEIDFINVVTGAAFTEENALSIATQGSSMPIKRLHNCSSLSELFNQSRLVISAAGGTQFELLACCTPSILVVIADNQFNAATAASKEGWCDIVDARETFDSNAFEHDLMTLWNNETRLINMHLRAVKQQINPNKLKLKDLLPDSISKHIQKPMGSLQC